MSLRGFSKSLRTKLGSALAMLRHPWVPLGLEILSALCLLAVFGCYLWSWVEGNWPMLTDPQLQTDDARTSIFPFHRYAADPALQDDPIANEMLALVPMGVRLLYRITVPFTDVFIAPKIVQGVAIAILLLAGALLVRTRRAGLAAGALLVFAVLHDTYAVGRIAGGLPRAFAFPLFALWLAGYLGNRHWVRRAAPVLGALTYPSAMLMLLAAEGIYSVRDIGRTAWRVVARRLLRYAAVVGVCLVAALPAVIGGDDRGPIHTLEQARKEPAFGKSGRLWILPFADPTKALSDAFVAQFQTRGKSFAERWQLAYRRDAKAYAVGIFALLLLLPVFRLTPSPRVAVAFFCGALLLYVLSRMLAFRLFSPERYYSFGMRMASIAVITVVLGHFAYRLRPRWRNIVRNLTVAAFMALIWAAVGNGVISRNGMEIDQRRDRALYEFIADLPKDVRFATHPMDGDGIPYYSARATMGAFETLQPWFTGSWKRQRDRCEQTLAALYATSTDAVFKYADEHSVTHFLVNKARYRTNFASKSRSFAPFTQHAKKLLRGKTREQLVFNQLPETAVVFRHGRWLIVDVQRWREHAAKN